MNKKQYKISLICYYIMNIVTQYKTMIEDLLHEVENDKKIKMYQDNNCNDTILQIIQNNSTPSQFGSVMETITKQLFNGEDRLQEDHDLLICKKKIELKSARIKNSFVKNKKKLYQYDSLRPTADYDYILFCNVNFNDLEYFIIKKDKFLGLELGKNQKRFKENNVISTRFEKIKKYVTQVYPDTIHKYLV